MHVRLVVWVLGFMGAMASTAMANDDARAALAADGWQLLTVPGEEAATFAPVPGADEIEVRTAGSVGFLYRTVSPAEATGTLSWRWRVDKSGPHTDQTAKGQDDRPLAVHLWFSDADDDWSLTDWLYDIFGVPDVGSALTYVWGGRAHVGTTFANPHLPDGRGVITIAAAGDETVGEWRAQQFDYAADFERHFGRPAPPPDFIAISADTDDVGGMSVGRTSDLRFVEKTGATQ